MPSTLETLYNQLKKTGVAGKSYGDFQNKMADAGYRESLYKSLSKHGANVGKDLGEFEQKLGYGYVSQGKSAKKAAGQTAGTTGTALSAPATDERGAGESAGTVQEAAQQEMPQTQGVGQGGYTPSWQEQMAMGMTIGNAQQTAQGATKGIDQMEAGRQKMSPVGDGQAGLVYNKNLRKGQKSFNAETGRFEDTFMTTDGRSYSNAKEASNMQDFVDYQGQMAKIGKTLEALGIGDITKEGKKDVNQRISEANAELESLEMEIEKHRLGQASRLARGMGLAGSHGTGTAETDYDLDNLLTAKRLLERRINALEASRDNAGLMKGTGDVLSDDSSLSFGLSDLADSMAMKRINEKINAANGGMPNLTTGERALVRNYMMNQDAQQLNKDNWWYNAGQGLGQTLSFMKDFALTGGGFAGIAKGGMALGAKGGTKLATKMLGDYMTKNLGTKALGKAIEYAGKGVGLAAGAEVGGLALNNTVQAASSLADITNKQLGNLTVGKDGNLTFEGGKSLGEAVLSSQLSRTGENASELVGLAFDAIPGILGKVIQRTTAGKVLKKITDSKFWKGYEKTMDYLGVQSLWGEGMEEEYGMARDVLIGESGWFKDPNDPTKPAFFDGERQLDTWKTIGLTSMILRAPSMIVSGGQAANYYSNMYNLNASDKNLLAVLGDRDRYQSIKSMIDGADNQQIAGVLNNLMNNAELSGEEKEAMFMYADDLIKMRGFNIGNVVAAVNGFTAPPKVSGYNIRGTHVDEIDKDGNVLASHDYENVDDMKAGLYELQQQRADQNLQSDLGIMQARPGGQYAQMVDQYCGENGIDTDAFESALAKPSMERTDAEQQMVAPFASLLHDAVYDNTILHEEQSQEDGEEIADSDSIDIEAPSEDGMNLNAQWMAAQGNRRMLFDQDENLKQEVEQMESQGLSHQEIITRLDWARPEQVQGMIDYYNTKAKYEGYVNRKAQKIDEEAANSRERHTMKGTIDGVADLNNVHTITDGTNRYFLVSGDVTTDPATGQITGSTSGLIIGMDLDGSFVSLGDAEGYSVEPVTMSLDQFEEAERARLGQKVTQAIDPNQTMNPAGNAAGTAEQSGNLDNAGGEAGVNGDTGANEPPAAAPVEAAEVQQPTGQQPTGQPEQPAATIEGVTDEDGVKHYENGIAVDDAISDMEADGLDVNAEADLAISEAQEGLSKIKTPKTRAERVKNAQRQKELQGIIDYYGQVKQRYSELHPQYADATPFIEQLKKATSKKKADEILSQAIQAGVNPAEVQDVHTQKVSDIISKEEEERRKQNEVTDKDKRDILEKGGTKEGRAEVLDPRKGNTAEKRRKLAKLLYGDYFDDDFEAFRDVRELISQWLSKGRTLDPDSFGQELGWDMGVGKDSAKVSTMFAKRRENGGDGMLFNDFVHMVWEASGGRFSTEDVRDALIYMFQSAQEKSDLTEYQLKNRIAEAEGTLQADVERAEEEALSAPASDENAEGLEDVGMLPFSEPINEEQPAFLSDSGVGTDRQGNPVDADGKLIVEKVSSIDELTDDDFTNPTRTVELPALPENVDNAIGANGKPVIIKKNIFERNKSSHKTLTPEQSRDILNAALYTTKYYGQNQKASRPYNWVVISVPNENGSRRLVLLEINQQKDNVEIVHWHYIDAHGLQKIKNQAQREGGQILILPSEEEAGALSGRPSSLLSEGKDNENSDTKQEKEGKSLPREEYLTSHPLTEEQIMADTEATEDEKLNAIDFLRGEDDSAISRFYYDGIYERAANTPSTEPEEDIVAKRKERFQGKGEKPKQPTADPMAAIEDAAQAFREEQKSQDQQDIDDALKEFNDFLDNAKGSSILDKFMRKGLEGNDKAQSSLLDAFTLTNDAQRMFLKDLLRLASKVGYAYIKSGVHDVQAWSKKMSDSIGAKLKEVLGWDDAIISEFTGEVWNQKYTVDGQRMRLSEHAERLKNGKEADNAVNEHKEENNEAEKDVSLQQEASEEKPKTENTAGKPAVTAAVETKLEGDSAAFARRQEKIEKLRKSIRKELKDLVMSGEKPWPLSYYKKLAKDAGLEFLSDTDLQELIEAEVVDYAREIANDNALFDKQRFDYIVRLYNAQPTLSARDNDRINKQQYSTPAPMAFLMGQFLSNGKKVESGLEPSAGNGMLTINLPKEKMHVNDIDEMRLSNLQKQGFGEVTSQDGTLPFEPKAYDVVVTNPPFGNVTPKVYDGIYEISGLEHQMAINALESMKDDGRAAIIIGGNTEYNQNGSIKGKDRVFLNYLYSHYNVVDVINMDGKTLYSRQGTGYPVRMILINGRKEFNPKDFAPVQSKARAEQVKTYDELYKRISDDILSDSNKTASVHDTESGESNGRNDSGHAGTSSETGVQRVHTERGEGQHNVLDSNGQRVQLSEQPTNAERQESDGGRLDANGQRDTGLVPGTSIRDGVRGSSSTEPNRTTSSRDDEGRDGGGQGKRMSSVGEVSELQPSGGANLSSGGGSRPSVEVRRLGAEKVPYRQQSTNPYSLQSQMPAEQADVVKKALEELGDVDEFLVKELGYSSVEDLHHGSQSPENHGGLAAEQVDSVAMAIHQMNQGNAFIIGDQTGVGKGRQAAALIRYGVKKGGCPVFISVKKGLFSDMYRDLCDIGSPELRPFIWSADDEEHSADVTDKNGNVVYKRPSDKEQKRVVDYINKNGKLPPEYDYIVTTYDSFKGGTMTYEEGRKEPRKFAKGKSATTGALNSQAKRDALERLAENSYVIMDESHNAGGENSAVSGYLQYITTRAKGVTFLSATFAKRPGNMPIYSLKTAISKAGVKIGELIDAVKRGGATFQEIMSKALTEAGQMIRRERDMAGVTIDWRGIEDESVIQKQREQYDQVIGLFNDIINFQRTYVDPIVDNMNDAAADAQGSVDHTPGTRDMGINNTPFASRTYNMVQQVLLSLKAEETAKRAIEHLKAGRKPVIALANTNEGAADEAAGAGDESMEMPDLSVNLKKGLRGTLRITKKDAFGNSTNSEIPFERISPEGQARYQEIMDAIESASTGLSLSPIDVIKNTLQKAGYKVGELTGRKAEFIYNEDGTVKRVKRADKDKKKIAADFNNGKLDALILNKSAGTGISLHASTKFGDQRQRIMIVAQAQGDVNDEVQIRGRIDRTGQVLRGMYEYVVSQIPSEQRLLMMLKAKLRSLDANTTSSQKSKFNEMQVQDIINKYGDEIVIQYLAEHTDLAEKMQNPLKWQADWQVKPAEQLVAEASREGEAGKTASKVLGRMALLTVKEQEKMLAEIGELYQAEIDRLNEMGENDLEITEMPLRAKTLSKAVWEQGIEPGGKNPFADNTYVEKVQMDVLKKPMKGEEVKKSQERLLGGKTWEEYKQEQLAKVDKWEEQKKAETRETITERAKKKAEAEKEKYIKGAKKAQEKNGMTDEEIERNGGYQYDTFYKQEMEKLDNALAGIEAQKQVFVDALEMFNTDNVYAIPSNIYDLGSMTFEPGLGKLIDIKISDNFSTSASTITFATLDGRRKITIPINGRVKQQNNEKREIFPVINSLTAQTKNGMFGSNVANTLKVLEQNIDNWDKLTSTAARKDGYIITGNLLKALVSTREQGVGGKLISYTTDTGEVRQGILMPDNFEPAGLTSKTPISAKKDELRYVRDKVESADGEVSIRVTNDWDWNERSYNTLELTVPKSKKKGEKYFNDEVLLSLMDGQFEGSGKMKAEFKRSNLDAVMKRLDELGVTVQEEVSAGEAADTSASGRRYDEDIEEKDKTFDNQLNAYKEGKMRSSDTFSLGSPSPILRACGVKAKKLILTQSVLAEHLKKHGLSIDDIRDLPSALNHPIMVYEWGDKAKSHVIITNLTTKDGRKITVTLRVNNDNVITEVSKITSVHGKDAARLISEMNTKKTDFGNDNLKYVDKEKALDWLAMDSPTESRQGNQGLDSAAKIIKEFENPKISTDFNTSKRRYDEETSEAQQPTGHKSRIVRHIDALVKKLGTKARTTVYHSLDEVPEGVRRHIEDAHKRGRKVRGWYENGQVYLFLPDIDSEYQAEKTIWHETVAHHGLRQLIGAENLDKLLKQLWLEHRDGEMGKWVTERMQKNGWKLNEAIEEYLAREAEKNPFKEPALWQRLWWKVRDVLHKMGFASDPTISDIKYLFWVSQNRLSENDPMSVIKQQEFLRRLEREAVIQPHTQQYVNMNAERVEDIYNPEAEGAYDDGKTIRHSEETDEEVLERLEKEPKVKVYRAMQMVDGKLYPPMAAKVNGKWQEPMELGKWARADEHPELVNKDGKFDLDKGNGKKVAGVVYAPYMHGSTTMLNDQFKEAQDRPELVVVEAEMPESELTSGYQAEKSPRKVGMLDWKAGTIQGQLTGTRQVMLSRWVKPIRIVPSSEVAASIKQMIDGQVEVMPTNVVTPEQREELEKLGVKFVKTDNKEIIQEGEHKGEQYSSVYGKKAKTRRKTDGHGGKKAERRFDEDIDDPLTYSAKAVYDDRLNRVETVFTEAYQDSMIALKTAQNAIVKDKEIPDSQNAYMAENLMHGKVKNEQDQFNREYRDPLIQTINKIMNLTGMNWGDIDRYVYTKSGLERNREFFVRDWLESERKKVIRSYEDLTPEAQDIFDKIAERIEKDFEDGLIDEEKKEKKLAQALQIAHSQYIDGIERGWQDVKDGGYQLLKDGTIAFPSYLDRMDDYIKSNIDGRYKPEKHDYSGFREMFGDEKGKYDEADIIDELMETEAAIDESPDGEPSGTVATLWERINAATRYGLERYREAGMRSDEQIDQIEQMFHFYVPMRGFKDDKGEDMYQYFTGKDSAKSYVGGLLKHAKGRGSEANFPISTIFAMSYKAISDCNQNLVNQKFYRLCQANPNDLVVLSDSWAVLNERTGEWEESAPDIPEDASEDEVREATLTWEEEMKGLALENKAKKIKGKATFDYKPMDKRKQSEHIVDVRINGQPRKMIVTGNPRMAQALNGQLRFEHGKNVFSRWNAAIKNFMASVFTSYSPTFALRNMFRDWTHFRMMLGVREGHGYAQQANKYYRQSLFKMVGLFKKYREGTLDESKEMERDFKDFMDNGGITGFVFMQKIDDIQKEMEDIYKKQKAGKTIRLNSNLWEKILGAVEALNEGIENNARFATYRASRHYAGRTKARSAYDAKEITVNFNRKGAGGKTAGYKSTSKRVEDAAKVFGVTSQILGEGKIFFNATVQAIATTFKNFQNADGSLNKPYIAKWAGKYALPPFMFGLLLPYINQALAAAFGGDGDDDPYANLPEWTRRKNLCFYIGNNNFITIPIGQELSAFLTLGDIMAGNTYAQNLKPVDKDFKDEMLGVLNTFSPVDIETKITKGGLMEDPVDEAVGRTFSVLAPLVAVGQNLGWTGRPIYREDKFQNDEYTPEYQMVYQGTNPVLVNASKLLHELGGGDDVTRGKLEVNPAIIQYLWEQYTGGPGKVFSNTISIGKDVKDIFSGEESDFNIRKVEGLKAFVQQGDDRTAYYRTQAKYRKYKEDAEKLYDAVKGYEGSAAENPEHLLKLRQITKGTDFVRMQIVREADKTLSKINKAANQAEGAERRTLRKVYNEQVKKVVDVLDSVNAE